MLRAVLVTALGLLLPALVGAAVAFAVGAVLPGPDGSVDPLSVTATAAGFAAGLVTAWWGPFGSTARRGTRRVLRALAPPSVARVVVPLLLVAAVALGAWAWTQDAPGWGSLPDDARRAVSR
nr:hypothetical protein [Angustibacter aerolatus]